ncbi:hypothetical protein [Fictibacillus macauensis]|uniref:hypothetical protein n=1 Tax=Fictibacillus macauensis TaxID=245160 RepID=UPI00030E6E5B|nr:hypothetical protein [Fictibacillus macauensis]
MTTGSYLYIICAIIIVVLLAALVIRWVRTTRKQQQRLMDIEKQLAILIDERTTTEK